MNPLIKGVTRKLFDKIKDKLTIYGSGAVNINTADSTILQYLGLSPQLVDKINRFRKGIDGKEKTEDDNIFKSDRDDCYRFDNGRRV